MQPIDSKIIFLQRMIEDKFRPQLLLLAKLQLGGTSIGDANSGGELRQDACSSNLFI
jgi:hypothetical protein